MAVEERRQHLASVDTPIHLTLDEVVFRLFDGDISTDSFIGHFNQQFPMPQAFLSDKRVRFDAAKIWSQSKISCEASAIVAWYWLRNHHVTSNPYFLTRQITNQDTHVYTVGEAHTGVWLYHLTDFKGLMPVRAGENHFNAIKLGQQYPVNHIASPLNTYVPDYQIFTTPEYLEMFCKADYQRRALRPINGLMYDD